MFQYPYPNTSESDLMLDFPSCDFKIDKIPEVEWKYEPILFGYAEFNKVHQNRLMIPQNSLNDVYPIFLVENVSHVFITSGGFNLEGPGVQR